MTETELVKAPAEERTPPPPLEVQYPLCPLCKDEVCLEEDSFFCGPCGATWPVAGVGNYDGTWDLDDWDNAIPQCASTIQPWVDSEHINLRPLTFRCDLSEDHLDADPQSYPSRMWDGTPIGEPATHRCAKGHDWVDADEAVITPAIGTNDRKSRADARRAEGDRRNQERIAARDAEWKRRRTQAPVRQVESAPVGEFL